MVWNEFFSDVKMGVYKQAYLFTGEEAFVKKEALQNIREAILPVGLEALNEAVLEGVNADRIIEAAETLPVMCNRRLVIVMDWAPLITGQSQNEEAEVKKITEWLKKPCGSCTLIFFMRASADGRKPLVKFMGTQNFTVQFSALSDKDIQSWVNKRLKPFGKKMAPQTVRQLVFTAGNDLTRLDGELAKLIAFSDQRSEIDEDDIEQIVSPSLEYGAFDMLNKLFEGDIRGAYRTLGMMLERGANRIGILASLSGQLRGMTFLRIASESSGKTADVQKDLELNRYAADIMSRNARRFRGEALQELYTYSIQLNADIKSGQVRDDAALDMLILRISSIYLDNAATNGRRSASK